MWAKLLPLSVLFVDCTNLRMSKDKRLTQAELQARDTMAIMGDEDSVTGFLIAGLLSYLLLVPLNLFLFIFCPLIWSVTALTTPVSLTRLFL
jgi:hypothetical protein